jgi:MoaA/NifB/PqqE/SkfB family radical SAM enzyme
MVDPANACQLHCPGCVHTSNPEWAKHAALDWPPGMLPLEQYRKILRLYGPFAFGAVLYNYGEPLLNSLTPHYIALARQYLLFTLLSTNLSLPKIDIEALVRSGLNHMIISIDGVTQKTYEQYRRGGNLDLVFENLRKLVEVKKRLDQKTPYLVWQFLTFEHNLHEVDSAIETANNMGIDAIQILTPLDVSMDDPTCRIAKSSREGYHCFNPWQARLINLSEPPLDLASGPEIDLYLNESLIERMQAIGGINEASHNGSSRCGWLYKNISIDGLGRILPCCNSPAKDRHLVFGNLQKDNFELWNSNDFVLSRLSLSDRKVFLQNSKSDISYCGTCTATSEPPNNLWRVAEDMKILDKYKVIPTEFVGWLTAW